LVKGFFEYPIVLVEIVYCIDATPLDSTPEDLSAMEALARRRRVHGEATTQPPAKPHSSPRYFL
jgi:hypothetical protein